MQKLDRLGWADGFSFDAYGVVMGVRATSVSVLSLVRDALPSSWTASQQTEVEWLYSIVAAGPLADGKARRFNLVYSDALQIGRTTDLGEALRTLERDMDLTVGERARTRVLIHAGVVAVNGRAILLPGRTLSGKSTLVAELVRAGAVYYSDEFAVLDQEGRVHPFGRHLSIRHSINEPGEKVSAADLGARAGERGVPVGAVIVTSYKTGARWQPRKLSPGQCVLELLGHSLSARSAPDLVLDVLAKVVDGAEAIETRRSEAEAAAQRILALARRNWSFGD